MRRKAISLWVAVIAVTGYGALAQAAQIIGSTLNGNAVDTDFGGPSLADFDTFFSADTPIALTFQIEAGQFDTRADLPGNEIGFSTVANNEGVGGWTSATYTLANGVTWVEINNIATNNGNGATFSISGDQTTLTVNFNSPELTNYLLGNPLGSGIGVIDSFDLFIDIGSLNVGQTFGLTIDHQTTAPVPEPGTLALLALGGGLVLLPRRPRA